MSTLQYSLSRHYCAKQMTSINYIQQLPENASTAIDRLSNRELLYLATEVMNTHRVLYNQNVKHATIHYQSLRLELGTDSLPVLAYELLAKAL